MIIELEIAADRVALSAGNQVVQMTHGQARTVFAELFKLYTGGGRHQPRLRVSPAEFGADKENEGW